MRSEVFGASAVLIGAMVGAGFLGIPHLAAKSGFITAAIHIIILGFVMLFVNLCLGETVLRTNGNHQLTGHAEKYLGKTGKNLMFISLLFGVISALIAYAIGIGQSLSMLITGSDLFQFQFGIAFIGLMIALTYFGTQTFKEGEIVGLLLMGLLFIGIVIYFTPKISLSNLSYNNLNFVFVPFGTVLFAFMAFTAIPEMERILSDGKSKMKRAIFYGSMIPLVGYLIFTAIIVGFKGQLVPEVATIALGKIFILLGVVTMGTSFLALSVILKATLHFDYAVKRKMSWALVSLITISIYTLVFSLNLDSFTSILNLSGVISGSLSGILILLIAKKSKQSGDRNPEYEVPINWPTVIIISLLFVISGALSL